MHQKQENICNNNKYKGEYYKALIDTLYRVLDKTFTKWIQDPYSTWLPLFEPLMANDANKMLHFYPILLNELKQKIKDKYLDEFESINAKKYLSSLHSKTILTLYNDEQQGTESVVKYLEPTQTVRDIQLMKINETFRNEINIMDQQIDKAQKQKNQLMEQIEHKKKTLYQ